MTTRDGVPVNGRGSLSAAEVAQFHADGYLCPLPALSDEATAQCLAQLERFEAEAGATLGKLDKQYRAKTHLLFPWLNALCRDPAVVRPVSDILGPDVLVYHVTCWLKEPGEGSFVSWHQDGTYFSLDPSEHVTAWVALTPSDVESGCLKVLPGTHRRGQLAHGTRPDEANLLSNGQFISDDLDLESAQPLALKAGQMSLHDTFLVHSSGPNQADHRRIGIGIPYIPTRVRFTGRHRVSASLVAGEDRYGHFDPEPIPERVLDPQTLHFHQAACRKFFNNHGYERGQAEDA